jgi:hypothetical protein
MQVPVPQQKSLAELRENSAPIAQYKPYQTLERTMPDEIDFRVSPALDPETYRSVEGYNDDTRIFVDCIVNAFSDIYRTVGEAYDARKAADNNPGWTDEQRILNVSRGVEVAKQRSLKRLALAERDLRSNIAHTEKLLSEPLAENAGRGSLNAEVRAHVKSLDRSNRSAFMNELLEQGDEVSLAAILGGQHFLSGLSPIDHAHYVRLYHERKNPQLVRRLDVMNRVLERVERNGPVVHLQFEQAIGAKPKVVAILNDLDVQAHAALTKLNVQRA